MVDLIGSMVPRCCEVFKELPFFFTQSNNVLFNHRFDLKYNLCTIVLTCQIFPDRPLGQFLNELGIEFRARFARSFASKLIAA